VPKYTIGYLSSTSLWKSILEPPCQFYPRLGWGRGAYTRTNAIAIYLKKSGIFPERNLCRITQDQLSDLIRDLELSKNKAKLLTSERQCESASISLPLNRFSAVITTRGEFSACKNVKILMAAINIRYNLEERRIFIDSSMHSLKAVLLHRNNVLPSIPIACAVHKAEIYENTKEIISCLNYKTNHWKIRGNWKPSATLMGL
jgi:hypothetical protein